MFSTDFSKNTPISNFVQIRPMEAKVFQADGRTVTEQLFKILLTPLRSKDRPTTALQNLQGE